jgi:drug/metabolite transporter (DMT)-like permease
VAFLSLPSRGPSRALAAALFTVGMWASAFVGIRAAGHDLQPGALALARMLIATIVLGLLALQRREPLPPARDLPRILLAGALWFGAYMILLNTAERELDAGTAAIIVNTGPILIAVLAGVVLHEGFPAPLVAGCAIAFVGVLVIGDGIPRGDVKGVLLALAAAAAYAAAVVAQKPALARTSAIQVMWLGSIAGVVVCLPYAASLGTGLDHIGAGNLAWTLYLGVFPTALAFVTWGYALARTTAGRMGAMLYLVPPIVIALGWLFLDETPPVVAILGGAICTSGVIVSRRRSVAPRPRRHGHLAAVDGDGAAGEI